MTIEIEHKYMKFGLLQCLSVRPRLIHVTAVDLKTSAGKYKITQKRDRPLTYEMANPPHFIAHRKSWNSWNCGK